jgi:DNA-binding NarL/FixJ family response regulator/succinate dehydrogenase/fumarate reductase flavoprotein subunit
MTTPIRVVLADDHAVLRAGLRALLNAEPDIEVVGEAANGAEALRQVEALQPNVIVMDLTMPGTSGLEAIRQISRHHPRVRSLVLTMHSEEQFVIGTIRAGGAGYVLKSAADVELIKAIRQVSAGERYFYGHAMQQLLDYHRGEDAEPERAEALSEREYEVLVLTVQGYSSREIGERLIISAKTVDTYRQRLMQKLGLNHRADLVQYALRHGLLESPGDDEPVNRRDFDGVGEAQVHAAESTDWSRTVDVVVVGSGTGMMAALRAAAGGLDVLVLEKAEHIGGTMGISGGGLWIPNNYLMHAAGISDSRDEAIEYIRHATLGQSDPALAEAFVDQCNAAIEFLRGLGIEWDFMPNFNDYYPHFPGGKSRGRTLRPVSTEGRPLAGAELTGLMLNAANQYGVEFQLETSATRLIVDNEGAVVGVVGEAHGRESYIKARCGVVLAAGGFDHNEAMVKNFLRGPLYYTSAVPTDTGDGHLMGMAIGASLRNMNERWGWPVFYDADQRTAVSALATELGKPGALVVNKFGQRILNEAGPYDSVARAFFSFDTSTYEYFNIPSYVIIDAEHRRRYSFALIAPGAPMPGWVMQAESLRALSYLLEIDPDALEETVAHFNANAAKGIDPEFHRGESDFDLLTAGDSTRVDLVNPCLAPLVEAPFYAAAIWPGALGTSGGLQTNTQAQVLNVWGKVIPGLYAVGNTAASPLAGGYPGGGGTLSAGLTFAYIAANDMLTRRVDTTNSAAPDAED